MGLFGKRRRQKHDKAAAEVLQTETSAPAPAEQAAPADQAAGARREVAAEQRPDPDRPGWGRTIGGEIGKSRQSGPSRPNQD
jgi:hypothetical protein